MRSNDQRNERDGAFEKIGEGVGGLAGRAAGQAADMAFSALNSAVGTAMKTLGGWWESDSARQASSSFGEREDRSCRQHFSSRAGTAAGRSYEEARPLYQFGHLAGQNPDYQGRSFEEVEPELKGAWANDHTARSGEWGDVRGYVGFAYQDLKLDDPLA